MLRCYKIVIVAFLLITGRVLSQPGNWEITGNMPLGLAGASAVVVDSSIYVLGGYSDSLQSAVDWIFRFNPAINSWNLVGHLKAKRVNFIAGKIGNKIYSIGGEVNNNLRSKGSLEVFDCNTGTSSILDSNMKFMRNSPAGSIIDSVLYIVGGSSPMSPGGNPYIIEYNIATKTITFSLQGPPGMRQGQMSIFFKNNIYLFGGLSNTVSRDIFCYNIKDHQLTQILPGLLRPRSGGIAVKIPNTDQVVIMGGYDENSPALNSAEIYDIMDSSNVVGHPLSPMHFRRTNFMAAIFDSSVYVFGGEVEQRQPVTSIEKLSFITGIDDPVNNSPADFKISQNYPNPFNPTTTIGYYVSEKSNVSIKIYDILGKEVEVLVNENKFPGNYTVQFNGSNISSGVYFYRIYAVPERGTNSSGYVETRKMILLK